MLQPWQEYVFTHGATADRASSRVRFSERGDAAAVAHVRRYVGSGQWTDFSQPVLRRMDVSVGTVVELPGDVRERIADGEAAWARVSGLLEAN